MESSSRLDVLTAEHIRHKVSVLDSAWRGLEGTGVCDAFGGSEYTGVRLDWLLSGLGDEAVEDFIRWRANVNPRRSDSEFSRMRRIAIMDGVRVDVEARPSLADDVRALNGLASSDRPIEEITNGWGIELTGNDTLALTPLEARMRVLLGLREERPEVWLEVVERYKK